MTENEAIAFCYKKAENIKMKAEPQTFIDIAKQLEELKQYRAIGLTPELIEAMQGHNVALINDLGEYQAIGTVEELKAYKQGNCTNDCKHYDSAIEYVRNKAIDEFVSTLVPRLTDAIYQKDVESMINLINGVAEELKVGGIDE